MSQLLLGLTAEGACGCLCQVKGEPCIESEGHPPTPRIPEGAAAQDRSPQGCPPGPEHEVGALPPAWPGSPSVALLPLVVQRAGKIQRWERNQRAGMRTLPSIRDWPFAFPRLWLALDTVSERW